MPTSPAIYARISSDRDGQQLEVQRQVEDCAALIAKRGWPPAQLYTDDDISAYSGTWATLRKSADSPKSLKEAGRRGSHPDVALSRNA